MPMFACNEKYFMMGRIKMKRKSKVTCYLGGMLLLGGIISAGAISAWTVAPGSITINVDSVGSSGGSAASHRRPVDEIPGETKINTVSYARRVKEFYGEFSLAKTGLDISVFRQALTGFYNLKAMGRVPEGKQVLSIVDFTKPSREKRLWIIDLEEKRLLYHTLVAHGKGSGGAIATRFSNTTSSHQSSLGFYVTGEVYRGKHGRSLRLDGMDPGFNCNARDRAIVLHGASYEIGRAHV